MLRKQWLLPTGLALIASVVTSGVPFPEASAEAAGEPIKIGATVSLTGRFAESGKFYEMAYRMWEKEVNSGGGLLARPVQFIVYDDKSDPETAVSLYERLITVDNVHLILGPYTSTIINAVAAVAEKHKMLFLQGGGNSPVLFTRGFRYMFLTLPGLAADHPEMMVEFIKTLPPAERPKSAAIIFLDDLAMVSEAEGAGKAVQDLGIRVVYREKIPKEVTDLTTTLGKVKESGAEVLFVHLFLPEGVLAVRAAKQVNYTPKAMWFSTGPVLDQWGETLKADGNYVFGSTLFHRRSVAPGIQQFVENFQRAYTRAPGYHAAGAYAAAQILGEAITATRSLNNDVLRDYVAGHQFRTVIGPLSWDATGKPKPALLLIQWIKGAQEIIFPSEAGTARPIYPMPAWEGR